MVKKLLCLEQTRGWLFFPSATQVFLWKSLIYFFLRGEKELIPEAILISLFFSYIFGISSSGSRRYTNTYKSPINYFYSSWKRMEAWWWWGSSFISELHKVVLLFSYKTPLLPPRKKNKGFFGWKRWLTLQRHTAPALNGSLMISPRINIHRMASRHALGDGPSTRITSRNQRKGTRRESKRSLGQREFGRRIAFQLEFWKERQEGGWLEAGVSTTHWSRVLGPQKNALSAPLTKESYLTGDSGRLL